MIFFDDYNSEQEANPLERFDSELERLIQSNDPETYISITKETYISWGDIPLFEGPSQHYDEIF